MNETSNAPESKFEAGHIIASGAIVFTGAVLFSTKAILVKLALPYGVEPVPLLLLRMIFAFPFYVAVLICISRCKQKENQAISNKQTPWIRVILLGFVGYYLASYFDFLGLKFISASLERVILYAYPTIVLIISALIGKKRVTIHQFVAVAICYLGIFIAVRFGTQESTESNLVFGVILIFLSATTYAIYLVGSGQLIPQMGVWKFTSMAMLVSTGCVVIHCLFTVPLPKIASYPPEVYGYAFAMATFATVIPSFLISEGIKRIGASNAAVIGGVGPISTIILAAIFLGETFTTAQLIGTLFVVAGVAYVSANMKRE